MSNKSINKKDETKEVTKIAKYAELFATDKEKADAFDKLAALYYEQNFGSTSKSDIDLLMFSLFFDQYLAKNGDVCPNKYILSKMLCITQSKATSLLTRKELKYPYLGDWRKRFGELWKNADYEDGKIKLTIPDANLFIEIQNEIDLNGGYVDIALNKNLLQVSPRKFLDIVLKVSADEEREKILKEIKKHLSKEEDDISYLEQESLMEATKRLMRNARDEKVTEIIKELGAKGVCALFSHFAKSFAFAKIGIKY